MNTNKVMDILNAKVKGSWFKIRYTSDVSLTAAAKREGHTCYKTVITTCRFGISYKNLASVKAKAGEGKFDMSAPHALQWGSWMPGQEGKFICHTSKDGKYKEYVRLYTSPNKPKAQYFLDGEPISVEALKNTGLVQNGYWNKKAFDTEVLTLCTSNIERIY